MQCDSCVANYGGIMCSSTASVFTCSRSITVYKDKSSSDRRFSAMGSLAIRAISQDSVCSMNEVHKE